MRKMACIAMALIMIFAFTGCEKSFGIPDGVYHNYINGKTVKSGREYAWIIKDNEAEYLYLIYTMIEQDSVLYFYTGNSTYSRKYEVSYDKRKNILTVYMPSDTLTGNPSSTDIIAFQFKKRFLF